MKKQFLVALLIIVMAFMTTACGRGQDTGETELKDAPDEKQIEKEVTEESENPIAGETFELTLIEYDFGDGEYKPGDYVPGAETFMFSNDGSYEYSYRNYPSYEDMVNDQNYKDVSVQGSYEVKDTSITMHGEPMGEEAFEKNNITSEWTIDGDSIVLILRDKSEQVPGCTRITYTKKHV